MRSYDTVKDYVVILEAAKRSKEPSLVAIAAAFGFNDLRWPNMQDKNDQNAVVVDKDICRAWVELGIHPKKESKP